MPLTESSIREALVRAVDPETGKDFVDPRAIGRLAIEGAGVAFEVALGYPARSRVPVLCQALEAAVRTVPGVDQVRAEIVTRIAAHAVQSGVPLLPGVKNIVAVASGKGGVGKSTTAANLALALVAEGARVGLLDADIYGPSQPLMMGVTGRPESHDGKLMEPLIGHGVQIMSIGFLSDPDQAMIWRAPMAVQALEQLLRQTRWDDLDYLVLDLPPGTGDIPLTLAQRVPLTGAVIVTTPQDVALLDVRKAVAMFEKVGVPILGLVENMAMHRCSQCGHVEHIFGADGGRRYAAEKGLTYLGALPLDIRIREQADGGCPMVAAAPQGEVAALYRALARQAAQAIAARPRDFSSRLPPVTVHQGA